MFSGDTMAVLGSGAWGTALAKLLSDKGYETRLWCYEEDLVPEIMKYRENTRYLPDVHLGDKLRATEHLEEALSGASMVLFAVPSNVTRAVARSASPHLSKQAIVVSAAKGMEDESLMFVDEVLTEVLPSYLHPRMAFLSGPSFAKELAREMPTAVVIAARIKEISSRVQEWFKVPYLRTYASHDVVGVECGGALKNVIAIATGVADGLGFGHNARAALMARGLAEMVKISLARGGEAATLSGLAGMGDLVLTCTATLSRNRTVGYELGRGKALADVLRDLGHVAEGVPTAKSAFYLSKKLHLDLPIITETYRVLHEGKPVQSAVHHLMSRALGDEFPGRV